MNHSGIHLIQGYYNEVNKRSTRIIFYISVINLINFLIDDNIVVSNFHNVYNIYSEKKRAKENYYSIDS